jgi:hypothetical protein
VTVSEPPPAIDNTKLQIPSKSSILQAVIRDNQVDIQLVQFPDGIKPVGSDHDRDARTLCQHNRLITTQACIAVWLDTNGIVALTAITGAGNSRFKIDFQC